MEVAEHWYLLVSRIYGGVLGLDDLFHWKGHEFATFTLTYSVQMFLHLVDCGTAAAQSGGGQ